MRSFAGQGGGGGWGGDMVLNTSWNDDYEFAVALHDYTLYKTTHRTTLHTVQHYTLYNTAHFTTLWHKT